MHPDPVSPHLIFGWDPAWYASAVFLTVYAFIVSERMNRAIVALLGAGLIILGGVIPQEAAITPSDLNTLGLLLGMMVIVGITGRSGVFQFLAIWSAKKVGARPVPVMVMLSVVTAVLSMLLDNVTTVLLIVPVTLLITEELQVDPYPFLVCQILFSNIGGTATLVGDPPNIMIGSAVGLTFNDFLLNTGPCVGLVMVVTIGYVYLKWGGTLAANPAASRRVLAMRERDSIRDPRLLKQALFVLGLVMGGFILAHPLGIEPGTAAMSGAALLLALDNFPRSAEEQSRRVHEAFGEAEWTTLMFFLGLFMLVHGLEAAGVIGAMAEQLLAVTGGEFHLMAVAILWGSALLSAFVDNIPFVATMIPLIKSMAPALGGEHALMPLWWALSLGACLGGNGTLIGASANLVVVGVAERAGHPISFRAFLVSAFPPMLLSIAVAHAYLYLRYL